MRPLEGVSLKLKFLSVVAALVATFVALIFTYLVRFGASSPSVKSSAAFPPMAFTGSGSEKTLEGDGA